MTEPWGSTSTSNGQLVPLYMLTKGRTTPRNKHLDLATLVTALRHDTGVLEPENQQIIDLCRETPVSIAELAAHLHRPLAIMKVLVDILLEQNLLSIGTPAQQAPDYELLQRVLEGLRRI